MLALDGTFLVILLSFVIFLVFMKTQFFTPVMAIQTERENTVMAGQQISQEAAEKALKLDEAYKVQLTEAKRKAQQVIASKREQAKGNANKTLASARETANQNYEAQSKQLQSESQAVYNSLEAEKEALAKVIIERLSNSEAAVVAS